MRRHEIAFVDVWIKCAFQSQGFISFYSCKEAEEVLSILKINSPFYSHKSEEMLSHICPSAFISSSGIDLSLFVDIFFFVL